MNPSAIFRSSQRPVITLKTRLGFKRVFKPAALLVVCFIFQFSQKSYAQVSVEYLIVGGGGGGGGGNDRTGGGGSGGRVRTGTMSLSSGSYSVTIGSGGRGGSGTGTSSQSGTSSTFNSVESIGGGSGGWRVDNGSLYSPSNQAFAGGNHHYGGVWNSAGVSGSVAYGGGGGYDASSN